METAGARKFLELFKLRICSLITVSAVVGLVATNADKVRPSTIGFLVLSTMLASMSASAFNHYFDRDIDARMQRTQKRPVPAGVISDGRAVLLISALFFLLSILVSINTLNTLVALHLALGAFVYGIIYTVVLKRRSWTNIVIGGLAGSFSVLAGGASARPEFCLPPLLIALVMFFWTPTHFWSFAILHKEDYKKAGIPMLPVVIGDKKTALFTLINTVLLVASSMLPVVLGYSGQVYLWSATALGGLIIALNVRLFKDPARDMARKNFRFSMVYLGVLFAAIIMDGYLQV